MGESLYKIYATRQDHSSNPNYNVLVPYEFETLNRAADCCVNLYRQGYCVHKVILPTGREIHRAALYRVLAIGLHSTRAAFQAHDQSTEATHGLENPPSGK